MNWYKSVKIYYSGVIFLFLEILTNVWAIADQVIFDIGGWCMKCQW